MRAYVCENRSPDHHITSQLDMEQATNLVSTRHNLTVGTITPPLTRQARNCASDVLSVFNLFTLSDPPNRQPPGDVAGVLLSHEPALQATATSVRADDARL